LPIRASSSKQIDALIVDLAAGSAVARETALARLTLFGARAVERLIAAAQGEGPPDARAAAWRALDAIGDVRALEPALAALADAKLSPVVGAAAAGVARSHVRGARGAGVVDRLATVLLDRTRDEDIRLAAFRALDELDPATMAPVRRSLADDPSPVMRAEAAVGRGGAAAAPVDTAALLTRAADGTLPDDPGALRQALSRSGTQLPLPRLLRILERVREREGAEPVQARDEWRLARAAAHVALAARKSRLALYDLRESIETAKAPLPVEFLTVLSAIGDASCLEAVAGAHRKAQDGWWRTHLAEAFRTIVAREKLTSRHAALRRIEKRWPGAVRKMDKG
jgi:HEAT repeat protein